MLGGFDGAAIQEDRARTLAPRSVHERREQPGLSDSGDAMEIDYGGPGTFERFQEQAYLIAAPNEGLGRLFGDQVSNSLLHNVSPSNNGGILALTPRLCEDARETPDTDRDYSKIAAGRENRSREADSGRVRWLAFPS